MSGNRDRQPGRSPAPSEGRRRRSRSREATPGAGQTSQVTQPAITRAQDPSQHRPNRPVTSRSHTASPAQPDVRSAWEINREQASGSFPPPAQARTETPTETETWSSRETVSLREDERRQAVRRVRYGDVLADTATTREREEFQMESARQRSTPPPLREQRVIARRRPGEQECPVLGPTTQYFTPAASSLTDNWIDLLDRTTMSITIEIYFVRHKRVPSGGLGPNFVIELVNAHNDATPQWVHKMFPYMPGDITTNPQQNHWLVGFGEDDTGTTKVTAPRKKLPRKNPSSRKSCRL
jgi:hypothetical protein